ncbi:MAG: betaine reductase [Dethiosulfovibrio peptidovorans]|nr:MAG: betaine reductase [Dethiosulfovibrio peptidovorans]
MRLEIGSFPVRRMEFGERTRYEDGVLFVNKEEALNLVLQDRHVITAELHIVHPGDMVRITPVKDAFEPRCKISGGQSVFPGFIDELEAAGEGVVHALTGCSVLAVGRWGCFQDGLIDMGGEFQDHTIFGNMVNLVLLADTDEEDEKHSFQKKNLVHRRAGMRLASYLGECLRTETPVEVEVYDLPPLGRRGGDVAGLPRVGYIMKVLAQWEDRGYNAELYGWDTKRILPIYIHPNEILDGAVVGGSFTPASNNMSTYSFQRNAVIRKLMREHGKTVNFIGVILSNETVELSEKRVSVLRDVRLAQNLGLDGVLISREGYGNADVGFMLSIASLEKVGIKTVGVVNECTGKDGSSQPMVLMRPEADALVSAGNVSEVFELPPMPVVLGDLQSVARDGCGGGWEGCVRDDGSLTIEAQAFMDGDAQTGFSVKSCAEF